MTSILDGATDRRSFAAEGGRTGANFETARLADGTPVVIKFATPDDWLVMASGGVNYMDRLWRAGVFERIPPTIDHTLLAIEPYEDGHAIVMRDVSDAVLVEGRVLSRDECRLVLRAMWSMYDTFWGEELPGCPLGNHLAAFTPAVAGRVTVDTPIPGLMKRGWELFAEVAPPDITDAMHRLLDDPAPLAAELSRAELTLTHGDLRLHNMGLDGNRLVLLDWEVVGTAPPAFEFGWFLIISASRIDATREEITSDFIEASAERFDAGALELGMTAALLKLGWNKAIDIVENPDPAIRAQERSDLDWWVRRVRTALEVWSPV